MNVHDIPFRKGSIPYQVMLGSLQGGDEGGWAYLTIKEIAEVLHCHHNTISNALYQIRMKTGYDVPHANGYKAKWKDEYGE